MRGKGFRNNGCPYNSSRDSKCSHKEGSTHCIHNNPLDCDLFIDWQELNKSAARMLKKASRDYPNNDI